MIKTFNTLIKLRKLDVHNLQKQKLELEKQHKRLTNNIKVLSKTLDEEIEKYLHNLDYSFMLESYRESMITQIKTYKSYLIKVEKDLESVIDKLFNNFNELKKIELISEKQKHQIILDKNKQEIDMQDDINLIRFNIDSL